MFRTIIQAICALALLLGFVAGCAGGGDASLQTEEQSYRFSGDDVTITAVYTNHSNDTVYMGYCGRTPPRYHLEKNVEGTWSAAYEPICLAILVTTPFPVAPGESHTDQLKLTNADDIEPRFQSSPIGGDYRLVYDVYSTWNQETGQGELLPLEQRVSNTFAIIE